MGLDHLPLLPVGPELPQPGRLHRHGPGDALPGQHRGGDPAPGRGGLHLEADGHQLREPARSAPADPGLQRRRPHRRPRPAVQIRSHRPPRRSRALHLARRVPDFLQPAADGPAVGSAGHPQRAPAGGLDARPLHDSRRHCAWVNYVRCHDDIGWTFSDEDAARLGDQRLRSPPFLNAFYTGRFAGSFARGLPFQENPKTGDCRISGTCASLAGLEKALHEETENEVDLAMQPHPADPRHHPHHRRHSADLPGR